MAKTSLTTENIKIAIEKLAEYRLGAHLDAVDGQEAHRVLPSIWPVIKEIRLLSDACEASKLQIIS